MTLLLLLACSNGGDNGAPTGDPAISIVEPVDDAVVCGTPLRVVTEVSGIELVEPGGDPEDALPGTGHVDVTLNGQDAAMGGEETVDIPEVSDGLYQLKVELSNADHTPVEPYAGDFLYVSVSADACEVGR